MSNTLSSTRATRRRVVQEQSPGSASAYETSTVSRSSSGYAPVPAQNINSFQHTNSNGGLLMQPTSPEHLSADPERSAEDQDRDYSYVHFVEVVPFSNSSVSNTASRQAHFETSDESTLNAYDFPLASSRRSHVQKNTEAYMASRRAQAPKRKRSSLKSESLLLGLEHSEDKKPKHLNDSEINNDGNDSKLCSICLEIPEDSELTKLDGCMHGFCFNCIEKWAQRENTCPLCKTRFNKIERIIKSAIKGKSRKGSVAAGTNSKKIKNRNQSADQLAGNPLQSLLATLEASGAMPRNFSQVIFSDVAGINYQSTGHQARTSTTRYTSFSALNPSVVSRPMVISTPSDYFSSTNSNNSSPVILTVRQNSYSQSNTSNTTNSWPSFISWHPFMRDTENSSDDDFYSELQSLVTHRPSHSHEASVLRSLHIEVEPSSVVTSAARGGMDLRTSNMFNITDSLSPRSFVVNGQGSADRPLEIVDSDDESLDVFTRSVF